MPTSPFRRLLHRVLIWSGPTLLVLVAVYQLAVWECERFWFESLGYGAHFSRLFGWRAGAFTAGALLFGGWMGLQAHIAWRNAARRAVPLSFFQSDDALRLIPLDDKLHLDRYRRRATLVIVGALAWVAGLGFSARTALFIGALRFQSTGISDAASGFDLAFFLFALPFYNYLSRFLLMSLVAALLLATAIYLYEGVIGPRADSNSGDASHSGISASLADSLPASLSDPSPPTPPRRIGAPRVSRDAAKHLAILWSMLLIWKGLDCILSVPRGFVSSGGVGVKVFDPLDISFGWTTAGLFAFSAPLIALLSGLSIAREPRYRNFAAGAAWMLAASVMPGLLPLVVARDARNSEWTGALSRHIEGTRRAWGLEKVTQRGLSALENAPFRAPAPREIVQIATESSATNSSANAAGALAVRSPLALWPALAAQTAFNRRLEAGGSAARVGRVWLERGGETLIYRGLASLPRPDSALPWRARRVRAARGTWLQMEAAGALPGGGPRFLPDILAPALVGAPLPRETGEIRRRAPDWRAAGATGAGEDNDEWIMAAPGDSGIPDSGNSEAEGSSAPLGVAPPGVAPLGVAPLGWGVKALLALRFLDPLLVRETTGDERVIWHRGAAERCQELAPFLDFRAEEARPVWLSAGIAARTELKWIVPGLVWSQNHPDSATPTSFGALNGPTPGAAPEGANYGRMVAAGVVDARTGATTLYLLDEDEPFVALYNRVFPGLFALPTAMPGEIRAALRPSPALLGAQSLIWARYHEVAPLSWLGRRSDYRPLLFAQVPGETPWRALASQPAGDWNLMAYARPEGQVGDDDASPLAAILGADERDFGFSGGKTRFVEWRAAAPLTLPNILVEPVVATPEGSQFSLPALFGVAPRLDARGAVRGLLVTRGAATFTGATQAGAAQAGGRASSGLGVQLKADLRISGAVLSRPPVTRPAPPIVVPAPVVSLLQQARQAWREVRAARQIGDWQAVARAEKRLGSALENGASSSAPTGTR